MSWIGKLDRSAFAAQMLAHLLVEKLTTGTAFNPRKTGLLPDPHPVYRALRERDPVHRSGAVGGFVLTRYRDCFRVLADPDFSVEDRRQRRWPRMRRIMKREGIPDPYEEGKVSMLRLDPPEHTRLRSLVNKAFTPRMIDRRRTRILELVEEHLAPLPAHGEFDLMKALAEPLPVLVIAELLGVPGKDRARFRHWSDELVLSLGNGDSETLQRSRRAGQEIENYMAGIAEERRQAPRDDLISALVAAEEAGDRLNMGELLRTCTLLLVAGNETTTKLIGNGVLALLDHPDQLGRLREAPQHGPAAVEEMLRYDGPVQMTSRIALRDTRIDGKRVRRGDQVMLLLAAANRDPEQFEEPDRFIMEREAGRHLAFGRGAHFCLGARLARLEAELALAGLLARYPKFERGAGDVVWGPSAVLRGPRKVPLRVFS